MDLLQAGLDSVVSTEPHIVVVAIESAGLAAGLAGLRGVERALSAHARVPVVTMGGALVEWLLARPSMRRVALVAPVAPWVRGQLVRVLREASLEVGAGADGPIGGADGTPEQVVRALRACAASGCDAVIQWGRPVSPVAVSDLAPWVGVPVVSSVHALLDIALDRLSGHVPRRVESTESGMAP